MKTTIKTTPQTLEKLDQLKLTKGESYENIIVRLLLKHKEAMLNDLHNPPNKNN